MLRLMKTKPLCLKDFHREELLELGLGLRRKKILQNTCRSRIYCLWVETRLSPATRGEKTEDTFILEKFPG